MNKALYTILCILISFSGFSQLTNQWVDYNKSYYKFKVVADGAYRIDYATLQNAAQFAGLPLNSINRKDFQIFGRGQELYIHVEGAGPNSSPMVAGDYIEFFAETDLLGALSACPGGDCSAEHSSDAAACYPLLIEAFQPAEGALDGWASPTRNGYSGSHGL